MVLGQTLVEHSTITAGSARGAVGMKGVGQAAAKIFENADKALGQDGTKGQTSIVRVPRIDDKQSKPNATVPDAKAIRVGMAADQLTSQFGPPAMKVNEGDSETWFYGSGSNELVIELKAGKVASVTPPKKQNAVQETLKSDAS
jgi:hypothetical protein